MHNIILLVTALLCSPYNEQCKILVVRSFIETSIQKDIISRFDFEDELPPNGGVFYFPDIIEIDTVKHRGYRSCSKPTMSNEQTIDNSFALSNAGYVAFSSSVLSDTIMVDVLLNRGEYLNTNQSSKYLEWRVMNLGMSYVFIFDRNNLLRRVEAKPLN